MKQVYTDQGNIGIYIPAGSYTIVLHNGSILAGETHKVTLTLNASYGFIGCIPTTIYHDGFCEVYEQNPDKDSTALMLSAASWVLVRTLKEEEESSVKHLPEQPIIATERLISDEGCDAWNGVNDRFEFAIARHEIVQNDYQPNQLTGRIY